MIEESHGKPPDPSLALAARQQGVVARWQLIGAGMPEGVIDRRLRSGWFEARHRGVYRVGPVSGRWWRETAAFLACGPHAAISHSSAAVMRQLMKDGPNDQAVEVISLRSDHAGRSGIRVRRLCTLRPDEIDTLHGIPVTTAARTLLDLSAVLPRRQLEQALAEAIAARAATSAMVMQMVARHSRQKGVGALRALLDLSEPALVRSEAEERTLTLIITAGLPRPRVNVRVAGFEVDFLWQNERLIVEVDGFAAHSSRQRFERDRARDAALVAAGYRCIRITWRQLSEEPIKVAVRLAQALLTAR